MTGTQPQAWRFPMVNFSQKALSFTELTERSDCFAICLTLSVLAYVES